jgi:hypothetical protein
MAVIDDNMPTAWRSGQIEYLRSENGPHNSISGAVLHLALAIVGRHKQPSPEETRPTPTAS